MKFPINLIPAYGRSYSTVEAATADWEAGKDFRLERGPYCSIRDIDALRDEFSSIHFRIGPDYYSEAI